MQRAGSWSPGPSGLSGPGSRSPPAASRAGPLPAAPFFRNTRERRGTPDRPGKRSASAGPGRGADEGAVRFCRPRSAFRGASGDYAVTDAGAGRPTATKRPPRQGNFTKPGRGRVTQAGRPRRGWARGQTGKLTSSPGARYSDSPAGAGACPALREAGEPRGRRCHREARAPPSPSCLQSGPGLGGVCGGSLGLAQSA